ncbi:MAG: hypothetical protein EXR79_11840 [Myxococcales bacterium]|nr:hypothetical protein [Myxococcales bacterium]
MLRFARPWAPFLVVALAALPTRPAAADVPAVTHVSGALLAAGGTSVADGEYNLVFSLYPTSSGGSAVSHRDHGRVCRPDRHARAGQGGDERQLPGPRQQAVLPALGSQCGSGLVLGGLAGDGSLLCTPIDAGMLKDGIPVSKVTGLAGLASACPAGKVGRACTIGARCSVAGTRSPGRTARSTPLARTDT